MFQDVSQVVLCGKRHTFATFSDDALHFRGKRSTLETSNVILRGKHSTLDMSCCVFSANRIVSAAKSGDKVQIPWLAWHLVTGDEKSTEATLYTLQSHSTLHTLHFTLHTSHPTLCT